MIHFDFKWQASLGQMAGKRIQVTWGFRVWVECLFYGLKCRFSYRGPYPLVLPPCWGFSYAATWKPPRLDLPNHQRRTGNFWVLFQQQKRNIVLWCLWLDTYRTRKATRWHFQLWWTTAESWCALLSSRRYRTCRMPRTILGPRILLEGSSFCQNAWKLRRCSRGVVDSLSRVYKI